MQSDKILCKIILRNGNSNFYSLTGEIEKNKLTTRNDDWIMVENVVFQNSKYVFIEMAIFKPDIEKLVILKPREELTFSKNDIALYKPIQFS